MRKDMYVEGGICLQKTLSQAGVASCRTAETLIAGGRVQVNGQVVRSQGIRIDPHKQNVHVDGERVFFDEAKHLVIAINKPVGVVLAMSGPEGRPTSADLVVDYPERLYNVGCLDINTSGLFLLTNDGELANRFVHPPCEVPKAYVVRVHDEVKPYVKHKLMEGIELEDGPIKVDVFRVVDTYGDITSVEIVIHEGRNRLVRHTMDQVGYPVRELVRTVSGLTHLGRLQPSNSHRVKDNALKALYSCVGL